MKRNPTMLLILSLLLATGSAGANERGPGEGEVTVPLSEYQRLLESLRGPRPAPAGHALGKATVAVNVQDRDGRASATVDARLTVRTLENEWTLVPLLAAGTAVTRAEVDGRAVELVTTSKGLAWSHDQAGTFSFRLGYEVDARRHETGYVLALPLPGAATEMIVDLPGDDLDVAIVPSVAVETQGKGGGRTRIQASLPPAQAAQISWRAPSREGHVMSRARYQGRLEGEAIRWNATLSVELFTGESVSLPLLPRGVTLSDVTVDGKQATVLAEDHRFATLVKGRGLHEVGVEFQVPVVRGQGPPRVMLDVPEVPMSRFDLTLPGDKSVEVEPPAAVTTETEGEATTSTVWVPMTNRVVFTWTEAIPEDVVAEVRANAELYHTAHAEEGVLHVRCTAVWEITRGETSVLELAVPESVQINRIRSSTGAVSDWRVTAAEPGEPRRVSVFLDRKVKGRLAFVIDYERLLGAGPEREEPVAVPLLRAVEVHRQRGMVALLSGPELALRPETEERLSKVGENQLPPFVRDELEMTVAHTYKYIAADPALTARAVAPERKRGKFDAQVDTLVSIGEVTLKGAATIEVNVKSGSLMALELRLPGGVSLLGLSGPSKRTHEVTADGAGQRIDVEFTQEMEGQFRLELSYERILSDVAQEVMVPTVSVVGAEVEHGRIAVEALTAVEVQAETTEQLSEVDINELPQQLVLKTTNPILLAYKYVHAEPPYRLGLRVTRHQELAVKDAEIERAVYHTLFTRDGQAVTRALFSVRNSRRQFLKVELPEHSEVWSVFVAGRAEKPALADGGEAPDPSAPLGVLIKMINSADGFPVELIYATRVDEVGPLGKIASRLPRPEMVVTHTRWDVYLPAGLSYREPDTNMDLVEVGTAMDQAELTARVQSEVGRQAGQPLRIAVPTRGVHFAFEKLYANQSEEDAYVQLPYSSAEGERFASVLSLLGALLFWAGLGGRWVRRLLPTATALALMAGGLVLLAVAVGYFGTGLMPAQVLSLLLVAALLVAKAFELRSRRVAPTEGP